MTTMGRSNRDGVSERNIGGGGSEKSSESGDDEIDGK